MTRNESRTTMTPEEAIALLSAQYTGDTGVYVMDGVECVFYQATHLDRFTAYKLIRRADKAEHWHWAGKTSHQTLDFCIGNTRFSCTLNKPEEASK